MRKILAIFLALILTVGATTTAFAESKFTDIKSSNWAYSYITKLTQDGAIQGYSDGTFKPQSTITVAEFVKTIVALIDGENKPLENDSHWASGYMFTAVALQIVPEGMFTKEDWNKPITRQKMGVIMERTAQLYYKEDTITDDSKQKTIIAGIKDYDTICDYCKDYIVQAIARGLVTGYSDGTFKPEKTATRAEATAMIVRLIDKSFRVTEASKAEGRVIDINDYAPNSTFASDLKRAGDTAVLLSDGSKFNISYGTKYSDKLYTLKYNDVGRLYGITSSGTDERLAQHVPVDYYTEVLCDGNIKDYTYLAMWSDGCLYVFPNPFL